MRTKKYICALDVCGLHFAWLLQPEMDRYIYINQSQKQNYPF